MEKSIYSEVFVSDLFNTMSRSYQRMNTIASFGFYSLWRKQAIRKIKIKEGDHVTDLMTGIGECWGVILKKMGSSGKLTALDFSKGMLNQASRRKAQYPQHTIQILEESVFTNSIPSHSQDAVICTYGIKTLTHEQIGTVAKEIHRILKPHGQFSLIDVSLPKIRWLSVLYLFYIARVIPLLSSLYVGDKESYKMLGIYAKHFKNIKKAIPLFTETGFSVTYCNYFFGCATGIYGSKSV
jgi:ubiquinone/menaquinone biosynthesis methyltransferase